MSGYEKEPDYGGPEPSWREAAVVAPVILGFTCVLLWLTAGSMLKGPASALPVQRLAFLEFGMGFVSLYACLAIAQTRVIQTVRMNID